jgi:hypothetical protein
MVEVVTQFLANALIGHWLSPIAVAAHCRW